jgi:hypothetical protein
MSDPGAEVSRDELRATLAARQELGGEYEPALVDALAERVEQVVQARLAAEMSKGERRAPAQAGPTPPGAMPWQGRMAVALTSLGIGIPLTAAAAFYGGVAGLAIAWAGIAAVNVAVALGPRHRA